MALPVAEKWDCPACTYLNWLSSQKCTLCGCQKPHGSIPKAAVAKLKLQTQASLCCKSSGNNGGNGSGSGGASPLAHDANTQSNKWMCKECTYSNWPNATSCIMCSTPRTTTIKPSRAVVSLSESILDYASGAVVGNAINESLKKGLKSNQSPQHDARQSRKWRCLSCTYENWPRSYKCVMCNKQRPTSPSLLDKSATHGSSGCDRTTTHGGGGGGEKFSRGAVGTHTGGDILSQGAIGGQEEEQFTSHRLKSLSTSSSEDFRQIRNRLSVDDWLFLNTCQDVVKGNLSAVREYLKHGGDRARQLTRDEVQALNDPSKFTEGSTLVHLAMRFQKSEILTLLLTPATTEARKRLPSQSNPDLAGSIREEVAQSLRRHKGSWSCYYVTQLRTFCLPSDIHKFRGSVRKKILDEILDHTVQKELEEEAPIINWSDELSDELNSRLYPLWNRTAGDCLLDSTLQATWGVIDRDATLRRTLADSLVEGNSRFFSRWKDAELSQAFVHGYSIDDDQLKADWASILSLANQKGKSLEQAHIFTLCHILRRPIIVYGVKIVKNFRGENLGLANFEGIYLPLLWDASFCWTTPITLGYTRGHFSALVSIGSKKVSSPDSLLTNQRSYDCHVTYLPLVDSEGRLLPIHFLTEQEIGTEEKLLTEYCDCHVTSGGILTAKQTLNSAHQSHYLIQLLDEWLDKYHQLASRHEASNSCDLDNS